MDPDAAAGDAGGAGGAGLTPLSWASAAGLSAGLFLAAGTFQALIGTATAAYLVSGRPGSSLFFTPAADAGAFGRSPAEIVASEPGIDTYRRLNWTLLATSLGAIGILEASVAWFGLRAGAPWALPALSVVAAVLAAGHLAILATYLRRGARVGLADVPPFLWVPAALHLPALALGWMGRWSG